MRIRSVEVMAVGKPPGYMEGTDGEFLVTPMHLFPDHGNLLGANFVGLRAGPVFAVLVRVGTDEGLYGVGSVGAGNGAAVYVIEHHLKHILLGENPFDVELLWEKMYRSTLNYGRKGVVIESISAVDIALWDILGKALGQPVYNLLGGRTRDRLRVYASRLYAHRDLDVLASQARAFLRQGFTSLKLRFGYGPSDGASGIQKNLELVRTVRQVAGPQVELMADAYMGWNVPYAIRMIRRLEDAGLDLRWIEEPVIPDDIEGYAQIRRQVNTPISGGEHEFTRFGFRQLIERHAVDILQPDVNRVGGITEARRIWALAAAYNLPVIPHAGQMHNYHLVMANLNSPMAEYFPPTSDGGAVDDDTLFWDLFTGEPRAENGFISLSGAPGLGLDLNLPAIEERRILATNLG